MQEEELEKKTPKSRFPDPTSKSSKEKAPEDAKKGPLLSVPKPTAGVSILTGSSWGNTKEKKQLASASFYLVDPDPALLSAPGNTRCSRLHLFPQ